MQKLPVLWLLIRALIVLIVIMLLLITGSYRLGKVIEPSYQLLYMTQARAANSDRVTLYVHDLGLNIRLALIRDYPGWGSDIDWSPDGRLIAYSRYDEQGIQRDIYLYDFRDGISRRVSDPDVATEYNNPSWSPDGRYLVYHGSRRSDLNIDLYQYDLEGQQQSTLYSGDGSDMMPAWSPDGDRILFMNSGEPEYVPRPYLLHFPSGEVHPLMGTGVSYFTPAWSPDGSELVVASYNGVNFGLDIIRLDGSESRQLLSRPRHRATYSEPAWSPDGKWIAVTTFTESGSQIFIVPVEGGTLMPVTEVGAAFRQPVWNRAGISGKIE